MSRYYALMIQRRLFGTVRLLRQWGRIGARRGSEFAEDFASEGEAAEGLRSVGTGTLGSEGLISVARGCLLETPQIRKRRPMGGRGKALRSRERTHGAERG